MNQCPKHVDSEFIATHRAPSPWSEVDGFLSFCFPTTENPSDGAGNDWQGISKRLELRFGVPPSWPQWDEARGCFVISLRPYRWLPQLLKEWGDPPCAIDEDWRDQWNDIRPDRDWRLDVDQIGVRPDGSLVPLGSVEVHMSRSDLPSADFPRTDQPGADSLDDAMLNDARSVHRSRRDKDMPSSRKTLARRGTSLRRARRLHPLALTVLAGVVLVSAGGILSRSWNPIGTASSGKDRLPSRTQPPSNELATREFASDSLVELEGPSGMELPLEDPERASAYAAHSSSPSIDRLLFPSMSVQASVPQTSPTFDSSEASPHSDDSTNLPVELSEQRPKEPLAATLPTEEIGDKAPTFTFEWELRKWREARSFQGKSRDIRTNEARCILALECSDEFDYPEGEFAMESKTPRQWLIRSKKKSIDGTIVLVIVSAPASKWEVTAEVYWQKDSTSPKVPVARGYATQMARWSKQLIAWQEGQIVELRHSRDAVATANRTLFSDAIKKIEQQKKWTESAGKDWEKIAELSESFFVSHRLHGRLETEGRTESTRPRLLPTGRGVQP